MSKRLSADICVIGAGSAGLSVAAGAAQMGARTFPRKSFPELIAVRFLGKCIEVVGEELAEHVSPNECGRGVQV